LTAPLLALTGATGFVGSHVLAKAVGAGWQVRALARRPQRPVAGCEWVPGALDDTAALSRLADGVDAVIHVAGTINAAGRDAFHEGNVVGTLNMVEAARAAGVARFVHVSSLAARMPDLSDYGWSKARAEAVIAASGLDWTIVRPPAVYGTGDKEMLDLFRMAARGVVLLPPGGRLSLIEAGDLARLLLALVPASETLAATFEPDDGRTEGWTHPELARALGEAVGRRRVLPIAVPKAGLRIASAIDRRLRGARAKLSADRVRYFCHPDWVARPEHRPPLALWRPKTGTFAGLRATAMWYREQGWLA
jgi:uncharacterized protein YbjT (DUF2867 family)